jgi:hypothetical protein
MSRSLGSFIGRALCDPIVPLLAFSVALSGLLSAYVAIGYVPSATFDIAASFVWTVLLALWIVADARRRMGIPCFDFGLYCYCFMPITVSWYCIRSRGWRGVLLLLAIAGTWIVPFLVAGLVWRLLSR